MTGQRLQNGYSDVPLEVLNNDFVRDGYDFVCWNTKPDGTGTSILPNLLIDVQNDITLYAQWKLVYVYMQLVRLGAVSVTANVATFGTNAGLSTPSFFGLSDTNCFTLLLKLTTSADVDTALTIFRQSAAYNYGLYLEAGKLVYKQTGATSSINLQPNTTYYLKFIKNYTTIEVYLSIDNTTFSKVLSTSTGFNVINLYFVFGLQISYNVVVQEQYTEDVTKYRTPAHYTYEPRWITNEQWCTYGNRNNKYYDYKTKLKHSKQYNNIKDSTKPDGVDVSKIDWSKSVTSNCGHWQKDYAVYHPDADPYTVPEIRTRQVVQQVTYTSFKGSMDFNESYFILNNLKNKLKA